MSKHWKIFLSVLILIVATVWLAVLTGPGENLSIIACDVGQGDAFLLTRGQDQILIDGGPGGKVIDCLEKYLPFWDRNIEVVVLTHPQSDHFGGLIEVFKRFNVDLFISSRIDSGSQGWEVLKEVVGGSGVRVVDTATGSDVRLGMMYLDILHPSEDYFLSHAVERAGVGEEVLGTYTTKDDLNNFSVVTLIRFGEFEALFTGDIGPELSDLIAAKLSDSGVGNLEYLKVPHHGSKNGISEKLLDVIRPDVAVISVGKGNSYGHPHEEVIKLLSDRGIKILRTDETGDIVVETDGKKVWIED